MAESFYYLEDLFFGLASAFGATRSMGIACSSLGRSDLFSGRHLRMFLGDTSGGKIHIHVFAEREPSGEGSGKDE